MMVKRAALFSALIFSLCSCGDPNALTEDRISEIIADEVRLNPCIQFFGDGPLFAEAHVNGARVEMADFLKANEPFPVTVAIGGFDNVTAPRFQEFEAAGLLASKLEGEQTGTMGGPVQYRRYDLTERGRALYQLGEKREFRDRPARKNPLFCAGKGQVAEIVNFVIPAEGQNTTQVTIRWNTVDDKGNVIDALPGDPWSKIGSYRSDRLPLEGEGSAMLTLTNNGWELLN
ncbi:MAG: hypothetical protein ACREB7_09860 [Sphingopyxis sp.]|uniref:hypothetical protein n=1 Tax=Sphingopyxis sp. TaxID=1908224 RepID=UPI003D6CA473